MASKKLGGQLEGLFADTAPEPESQKRDESALEETVDGLLEMEETAGAPEPVLLEALPPSPTGLEEVVGEGVEDLPLDSPAWEATVVEELLQVEVEPSTAEPVLVESPAPPVVTAEEAGQERPEVPPPRAPAWEGIVTEQRVRILNILLGSVTAIATLIVGTLLVFLIQRPSLVAAYVPYFVAYVVLVGVTLARRLNPMLRAAVLVVLAYAVGVLGLLIDGPLGMGGLYLLIAPLLLSVLVGRRAGVVAAALSAVVYTALAVAHGLGWLQPAGVYDLAEWSSVLNLTGTFAMLTAATALIQWMFNSSLTGALQEAVEQRDEMLRSKELLEERADELALANALSQRRALQLETAAQVAQTATSVLEVDTLVQRVVDLIREQFDLYYVGLYLLGESGRWAVLRAGTGEAGRQMMEQGHRLMVAGASLVGWCTANAQARNVGDTGGQMTGFDTRLLPQTCSEMALPLRSRGRVIGALDVHSSQPEAFSEEDVAVYQILADQLAAAIDNAQLLAGAQARVEEMEASQQRYLRERWAELTSVDGAAVYERSRSDVEPLGEAIPAEADLAIVRQEMVVQSDTHDGARQAALVVPIRVRDEVIGALGLQETEGGRQWTADEIALIEAVADQLALAIENARLLAETRRRAERERLVTEISARVRASVDPDTILKTAVRELSQALGAERAAVQVTGPSGSAADAPEEEPAHGEEMS